MKYLTQQTLQKTKRKQRTIKENCIPAYPLDMDRRILNLSSHALTPVEKQALCLGLGFSIPPKRKEQILINAEFEDFYQQLSDLIPQDTERLLAYRAELVSLSHAFGRERIEHSSFLPCHREALLRLKRNIDLVISRPDKGSGVVIMDRADYVSKIESILSDTSKFQKDKKQTDETERRRP